MKWEEFKTCDNTIGTVYALPKAVFTPNSPIIHPTMKTCYKLTLLPKAVKTNEFIQEFLLVLEPLSDGMRLTSTTISDALKNKLRRTYGTMALYTFWNVEAWRRVILITICLHLRLVIIIGNSIYWCQVRKLLIHICSVRCMNGGTTSHIMTSMHYDIGLSGLHWFLWVQQLIMSKGESSDILITFVFGSHARSERLVVAMGCDGRVLSQWTQPLKGGAQYRNLHMSFCYLLISDYCYPSYVPRNSHL